MTSRFVAVIGRLADHGVTAMQQGPQPPSHGGNAGTGGAHRRVRPHPARSLSARLRAIAQKASSVEVFAPAGRVMLSSNSPVIQAINEPNSPAISVGYRPRANPAR